MVKTAPKLLIFSTHRYKRLDFQQIYKISRVPSPRNPAVYKTNLTNRHEKNSDVLCKGNNLKSKYKFCIQFLTSIQHIDKNSRPTRTFKYK